MIPADQYLNMARFAVRQLNAEGRPAPMLSPRTPEWAAWQAYFRAIGRHSAAALMEAWGRGSSEQKYCVPTEWPDEFDPDYTAPRPRYPLLATSRSEPTEESRARSAALFERYLAKAPKGVPGRQRARGLRPPPPVGYDERALREELAEMRTKAPHSSIAGPAGEALAEDE